MLCPYCKSSETKVIDKRNQEETGIIRRRRECLSCTKRFTTYEKIDMSDLLVVKRDGRREEFDSEKLRRGILRACEKRPINTHQIDRIIEEIEEDIRKKNLTEISSECVGEMILNFLKKLDQVAYIRFASVYRSYQSIDEFIKEVNNLPVSSS